jgi:hypothetical protein
MATARMLNGSEKNPVGYLVKLSGACEKTSWLHYQSALTSELLEFYFKAKHWCLTGNSTDF